MLPQLLQSSPLQRLSNPLQQTSQPAQTSKYRRPIYVNGILVFNDSRHPSSVTGYAVLMAGKTDTLAFEGKDLSATITEAQTQYIRQRLFEYLSGSNLHFTVNPFASEILVSEEPIVCPGCILPGCLPCNWRKTARSMSVHTVDFMVSWIFAHERQQFRLKRLGMN